MPTYTNQVELRKAFWEQHPTLCRKRIKNHKGDGLMHTVDTRVTFVDWIDYLQRDGQITKALADRATLER